MLFEIIFLKQIAHSQNEIYAKFFTKYKVGMGVGKQMKKEKNTL